jgi:hypothetical protein
MNTKDQPGMIYGLLAELMRLGVSADCVTVTPALTKSADSSNIIQPGCN